METKGNDFINPQTEGAFSNGGLTKREYFACLAMQSFINSGSTTRISLIGRLRLFLGMSNYKRTVDYSFNAITKSSVEIADTLIEALNTK